MLCMRAIGARDATDARTHLETTAAAAAAAERLSTCSRGRVFGRRVFLPLTSR